MPRDVKYGHEGSHYAVFTAPSISQTLVVRAWRRQQMVSDSRLLLTDTTCGAPRHPAGVLWHFHPDSMDLLFGSDAYTIPIGHKLSAGAYMHNSTVSDTQLGGFAVNIICR